MQYNNRVSNYLPDLEDLKSLILRGHSFSESGREHITFPFANKGSQYLIYKYLQPILTLINHGSRPDIIDPLLTLIFQMEQEAGHFLFCI